MKRTATLLIILLNLHFCFSQTLNHIEIDKKGNEMLLGEINKSGLTKNTFNEWFSKNYDDYLLNKKIVNLIKDSRFKFKPSKGTYFQVLDFSEITSEKDTDFAKRLTIEKRIASIPLSVFNDNQRDDSVLRFCFAKTEGTLKAAAEILNNI